VAVGLGGRLMNQCRKPSGWLGRLNLWTMNQRHSALTDWGLQVISIARDATILDVGCGGGRTISKLASVATEGRVYGVDFSETSVAASRRTNRRLIDAGRVDIRQAPVSRLPFAGATFDVVTAVETHYYWPDLAADLREIRRVLKPGGTLVVIAEAHRGGKHDAVLQKMSLVTTRMPFTLLTVGEHRELFENGGFTDVRVDEDYERGWVRVAGRKP
jgi:ubiquinone/menaquinone biosynthesis C-methylase UbiE